MIDPAALLASARTELARLPRILDVLLADVDTGTWRERPAPTEWSPIEIVCHLRDEELEDFGARLRVVVDGGTTFARSIPPVGRKRGATARPIPAPRSRRSASAGRRRSRSSTGSPPSACAAR